MPAQDFSIAYAGVTVGGASTTYLITGPYGYSEDYQRGRVFADVVVCQSTQFTEAQFIAACQALEAAYKTPRGALVVTLGSTADKTRSHSANSALNTEPSIEKVGSDEDTGRTRRYRIAVEYGLPANLTGQDGRQSSTVELAYDSSRIRTVTISGVYTALSSNAARAQYDASSATYFGTVKTALGITDWETIDEDVATDDANKYATFRVVKREIVYNQSSAGKDHANVVAHFVTFALRKDAPGDSGLGKAQRTQTVDATYTCSVRDTQDLASLWTDTLRPYVLTEFQSRFSNAGKGVRAETVDYDQTNQKIAARLTIEFLPTGASLLISETTMGYDVDEGLVFTGAWDGDKDSFYVDDGKRVKALIQTRDELYAGTVPPNAERQNLDALFPFAAPSGYRTTSHKSEATPKWVGLPGEQFVVTFLRDTVVKRFAKQPKRGGGATTTPANPPVTNGPGATTTPSQPNLPQQPRFGGH